MGTGGMQFPALPLTPVEPDAIQPDESPREECGVFGVWAPGEEVAKLTYYGLYALQHRGQEAAGIAVADGAPIVVFKDLGLVSQVFDEQVLSSLNGHIAVGHCRYSTTGSTTWENAQPTFATTAVGSGIALGHNGNLVNTAELARTVTADPHAPDRPNSTTDSDIITKLLAAASADSGLHAAAMELLPDPARRVLPGLLRREHPVRRPRPARHPPAGAGPAGPRLGGRLGDRCPGHRRCVVRPRGRAGRTAGHRRRRAAQRAFRAADAQGLPVRIRLPGPAGHRDRRSRGARHQGRDRPSAGRRGTGRGRPGDPDAGVRHARRRSATRRPPVSRTARAW